jgi:peptide deformylase
VAKLEVMVWPAKVLETRAEEVTEFDDAFRQFVEDMHETMHAANGIGLAANQVGVLKRVLTMFIPWSESRYSDQEEAKEPWHNIKFTFVNPKIVKKAGKISYQEGCLSFPEIFDFVDRAAEVWVKAQDENGKEFEIHATGLLAICLQHEIDHLDGVVFINRMSQLKREMIRKRIQKRGRLEVPEPSRS